MRRLIPLVLIHMVLVLWAAPALPASGQTAEAEDTGTVIITVRDCKRLLVHATRPDVTYKPGVDVRGRKVASADYAGDIKLKLPDNYAFDIPVDIRRFMGGPAADAKAESAAVIAADKATTAGTAAGTAATDAEAASTVAATLAGAGTITAAEAASIAAFATAARTAADAADSAVTAEAKATSSATAAAAAKSASDASISIAGADAAKAALKTAGDTAAASSTTATSRAADSAVANTARTAEFEKAARIGAAQATVGTVRYNISSGRLTFNGQSLTPEAQTELAHKCREMMTRKP